MFSFINVVNAQEQTEGVEVFTNSTLKVNLDLTEENGVRWIAGEGKIEEVILIPQDTVNISQIEIKDGTTNITTITTTKVLHSKWFYTYAINIWTQGDVYECVDYEKETKSFRWLELWTGRDPAWVECTTRDTDNFPVCYIIKRQNFTVNYDTYNINGIKTTGFNGRANLSVALETNTPKEIVFGDVTYRTVKQFEAIPAQITVLESETRNVGQFNTFATDNGETTINAVDITDADALAASNDGGEMRANLNLYLGSGGANLGVTRLQQSFESLQIGTNLPAVVGTDDILERGLLINIKPNILKINEDLQFRSQTPLVVDTYTEWFGWDAAGIETSMSGNVVQTTDNHRTIGWTVTHKASQARMRAEFDVYSTVEVIRIIEPTKPTLNLTTETYDDQYLDTGLGGETGVTIPTSEQDPLQHWLEYFWRDNWLTILIIGIIAIVVVVIYFRVINPSSKEKGSRTTSIKIGKFTEVEGKEENKN
jgi:hypothetical protein